MAVEKRRTILKAAMGLALGAQANILFAQEWPSGVIKLIVPFPAGGTLDVVARMVAPGLQQRLGGTTVIVENRPGASGSIGTVAAAKSVPDGRTWVLVFDTHVTNPMMQPTLALDNEKDLDPVMIIGSAPNVIACHPSRPYPTIADLIAAAKGPAKVSYASAGTASLGHLTMLLLAKRAGLKWEHIPYKGAAPAVTDAVAGHIDAIIAATTVLGKPIEAKSLRPLAQTGATRHPTLPNVPTLVEVGYPELDATPWWGLYGPAKTPKSVLDKFHAAFAASLKDEGVAQKLRESMGLTIVASSPEELRGFVRRQTQQWGPVVKENALKTES